jgi:hypothetical protein
MNPCAEHRGAELKAQLVRASMAAMDAIRHVDPQARFVHAEPLIHVISHPTRPAEQDEAEAYRRAQWEAWDMLSGRIHPALRGANRYLDVLGVNFYPDNEWYLHAGTIPCGHHHYRPLRHMLQEVFERYGQPIVVSETGAEGTARPAWLHYVTGEVLAAIQTGIPVLGVCLYPILDYAGWENERPCPVGLLGTASKTGVRPLYQPLADELRRQQHVVKPTTRLLPVSF